ncbi:hypothetical protein O0I10_009182 [Lichtheimia ornata]|uniref:Inositol-tetrakisphosphate 1-kinase n=1 Tax=Lichtheimia ornata TaxID=688661 RepID=A0AAD7XYY0_9FUNG|nr:uncharacterized protein O0I10_009182 [Lichtheimia ornata]KAJ8655147.1 hypothetical protein O0I10_009182 [Lichtheimia ornata]
MTATQTIGMVFSTKKLKQSRLVDISKHARSSGLNFVDLDLSRPIEDQMPLDMVVHKVSDIVARAKAGDKNAQAEYERFQTFCSSHPNVRIVDPLDKVAKLLDRKSTMNVCSPDHALFRIPTTLYAANVHELHTLDLTFPIFCKPQSACAVSGSHHMVLVPSSLELAQLQQHFTPNDPVILQEFIPHDGVLVKVYFAYPDHVFIFFRPSFKNIDQGFSKALFFDSQKLPKAFDPESSEQRHIVTDPAARDAVEAKVDPTRIQRIAAHLQRQLRLTFFGFDVLLESTTGEYHVIDVNYFPSFKEVDDFPDIFIATLKQLLEEPLSPNNQPQ